MDQMIKEAEQIEQIFANLKTSQILVSLKQEENPVSIKDFMTYMAKLKDL